MIEATRLTLTCVDEVDEEGCYQPTQVLGKGIEWELLQGETTETHHRQGHGWIYVSAYHRRKRRGEREIELGIVRSAKKKKKRKNRERDTHTHTNRERQTDKLKDKDLKMGRLK